MLGRGAKTVGLVAAAFLFWGALGLIPGSDAYSGGGKNYKIEVLNPTESNAWVRVRVSKALCVVKEEKLLGPKESYTFECGSWCPCGLDGEYFDRGTKTWKKMRPTTMDGAEPEGIFWSPRCESATFEVGRKAGAAAGEIDDGDYGFSRK